MEETEGVDGFILNRSDEPSKIKPQTISPAGGYT
jgi:hypothetical protein